MTQLSITPLNHITAAALSAPDRFIGIKAVTEITGLCRSSIYSYMAASEFPRSCKIGRRRVAWSMGAVNTWVSDRKNGEIE